MLITLLININKITKTFYYRRHSTLRGTDSVTSVPEVGLLVISSLKTVVKVVFSHDGTGQGRPGGVSDTVRGAEGTTES